MVASPSESLSFTVNREIELNIEKLVYGGYGLAFDGGRGYFILDALPEERVRARILREKKNTSFGKTVEVLVPSPLRIQPACPHFMRCGGCHLQHLDYSQQLRFKEEILRETFRRIGQITLKEVEIVPSEPWHYRTRAQFKVSRQLDDVQIGFFAAQSHDLRVIDRCPLLADKLNELLGAIQAERKRFSQPGITAEAFQIRTIGDQSCWAMEFDGRPPEFDFASEDPSMALEGFLTYGTVHGSFRIGSNSFFQVNRCLVELLVSRAIEGVSGSTAVDLFSGVGLFTVPLSRKFERVVAVEENPNSVSDLRENLKSNGCANVESITGDVLSILRWGQEDWRSVEFVLFDPPRQGVDRRVLRRLLASQVPQCAYVSCDPTSMARDLSILSTGGYQITRTLLVDFFPQTYHFETVVRLQRKSLP